MSFPKNLSTIFQGSLFILLISVFYSSSSLAEVTSGVTTSGVTLSGTPDAATMLENFAQTVPQLMKLVTAIAYVVGIFLIFSGIYKLKEYGEQRSQMSTQHDLKGPIILILVGTALLYIPSSVQVGLQSFWQNPNPYGYQTSVSNQWTSLYQDVFLVVQLIGTIAFIRGLLILSKMGSHGQPGDFAKGITYIIAGTLCINLYGFLSVINTTLGLTGIVQT